MLIDHLKTELHQREGKALGNFQATLPPPQSDLAKQMIKDPYDVNFLTLGSDAHKRDLEQGLLQALSGLYIHLEQSMLCITINDKTSFRRIHSPFGGGLCHV